MGLFKHHSKKKGAGEKDAKPSLDQLIALRCGTALDTLAGRQVGVSRNASFGLKLKALSCPDDGGEAWGGAALAFADSSIPAAAILLAADSPLSFLAGEDASAHAKTLLCAILGWEGFIILPLKADPANRATLAWQCLELSCFSLGETAATSLAWLYIDEELAKTLVEAKAATSPSAGALKKIAIGRGIDFPLVDYFCPGFRRAERAFSSHALSIACPDGEAVPASGLGENTAAPSSYESILEILGSGESPTQRLSFFTALDLSQLTALQSDADGAEIAGLMLREGLRRYLGACGLKPGRFGIKAIAGLPDSVSEKHLRIELELKSGGLSLPCLCFIPLQGLEILSRAIGAQAQPEGGLALCLSLNQSLLAGELPGIITSPELRKKLPGYSLNELFRLLSDRDLSLVLQNILIPEYGADGLPALLSHNASIPGPAGEMRQAVLAYGPLEEARLASFLPEIFLETFLRKAKALHGVGLADSAKLNLDALKKTLRAYREGRIEASRRLGFLLDEFVAKSERAHTEEELAALAKRGEPFASLGALAARVAQAACAALDDRDLAFVLLDAEASLPLVRKHVSAARMARLKEDILFVKKGIKAGKFGLEELLAAKKKFLTVIEEKRREAELE